MYQEKLILRLLSIKKLKKSSLGSDFDNKPQIAISGTKHTVTNVQEKNYTQ